MAQMEFVPKTISLAKAPTGFESDLASVEQKRAIANQLYQNAFNPRNSGWGGVIEQLGNALFAKLESNDVRKETGALNERIGASYRSKVAEIAAALKSQDPDAITDVYTRYGGDEQVKDFIKPVVDAFGKRLENQQSWDAPVNAVDTEGRVAPVQYNKAGDLRAAPGGFSPNQAKEINGVFVDPTRMAPGQLAPANPEALMNHAGAPNQDFVPNERLFGMKKALQPPQLQFISTPDGGIQVGDKRSGMVAPAPVGETGSITGQSGGSTILANNNVGAMKWAPWMSQFGGQKDPNSAFAKFPSREAGDAAHMSLITRYIAGGVTPSSFVQKYAPLGPENSAASVANYTAKIAAAVGKGPNDKLTLDDVPAIRKAVSSFETGGRDGLPPKKENMLEHNTRTIAEKNLRDIGYDPKTKTDNVEKLIMGSTSGGIEALGAWAKGQLPTALGGGATKGMENIAQIKVIANSLIMQMLGGKLGAQISDSDRKFVEAQLGEVGDPSKPANQRAAAWREARDLLLLRSGQPRSGTVHAPAGPRSRESILKQYGVR